MTVFEKNTTVRTVFLGVLAGALLVLLFQVSKAVLTIEQDVQSMTGQADALIARARWFVPEKKIDIGKINEAVGGVQSATRAAQRRIDATAPAVTAAAALVQKLGVSVDKVNAPCPPKESDKLHPCGTLADVAKTLNTGRGTLGKAEIAMFKFNSHEDELFAQEQSTWKHTDDAVAAFSDSMKHADAILADGQIEADKFTHPSKKKLTFWGAILATGQTLQKLSPPLF